MDKNTLNNKERVENNNQICPKEEAKTNFNLPSLDQFMEMISGENTLLSAAPSGYNVYNKYNKTS